MGNADKEIAVPVPILLVDDSPSERELAQEAARECTEVHLLLAASLAQALTIIAREPRPRLLLVDLNLGRENGCTVVQAVRGQMPAIILTTTDDPVERRRCLDAGAEDFWIKPLRFDDYPGMLARAVARARLH